MKRTALLFTSHNCWYWIWMHAGFPNLNYVFKCHYYSMISAGHLFIVINGGINVCAKHWTRQKCSRQSASVARVSASARTHQVGYTIGVNPIMHPDRANYGGRMRKIGPVAKMQNWVEGPIYWPPIKMHYEIWAKSLLPLSAGKG